VFLLGVVLLLFVFYWAYVEFVSSGALASAVSGRTVGDSVLVAGIKVGFLIVLGFVASAVANKGIALYQAATVVSVIE
jgi:hypothetical protein